MGLAVVPEGRMIFANLSVQENLKAFAANRSRSKDPWTLERVYHLFPLAQGACAQHGQPAFWR
jgi:branched-chain amino acid transport system ATP-binding protein